MAPGLLLTTSFGASICNTTMTLLSSALEDVRHFLAILCSLEVVFLSLPPRPFFLTLLDHLYTPNLYGVASGQASELSTLGVIGGKDARFEFLWAEVKKVDLEAKQVLPSSSPSPSHFSSFLPSPF